MMVGVIVYFLFRLFRFLLDVFLLLLFVSVAVFLLLFLIPGTALDVSLGVGSDRVVTSSYELSLGVGLSPLLQYFDWLRGIVVGDFGTSYVYNAPVFDVVFRSMVVTFVIAVVAFLMAVIVSIALGLYLGSGVGGVGGVGQFRRTPLVLLINLGIAVPQFLWAILFLYVFGYAVSSFVPGLYVPFVDVFAGDVGGLLYVVVPALALSLPPAAILTRYTYNAVRGLNAEPFVLALRCRGVVGWGLFRRHILRNLMVGYVTFCGVLLIDLLAGSVLVEHIFNIPGLGNTLITGIYKRDTPLVQGVVLYMAVTVVLINKATDALYYVLNPRLGRNV